MSQRGAQSLNGTIDIGSNIYDDITLTVLAILSPNCVIAIPGQGLGASFEGQFTQCMFFHDGQQTLPVTFVCGAWRQCLWTYAECDSPRRKVEVAESGEGSYSVNITAVRDKDKEKCWTEESTGYIFQFNAGGEIGNQVICALERHHMFFSRPWIEQFHLPVSLNHPEMVKEFLGHISGNVGLVRFLGNIVTDQDFRRQHGVLLRHMYDDYEAAVLSQPVVEERRGTGELTGVLTAPPFREFDSFSSCSRTEDTASAYSLSLSSTGPEMPVRAQSGGELFEPPPDTSIAVTGNVDFVGEIDARSGPNTVIQKLETGAVEGAMTESQENGTGGSSLHASESDEEEAVFNKDVDSLVERYGHERVLRKLLNSRVPLPEGWGSPPPTTCIAVQRQYSDRQLEGTPYCPHEIVSDEDQKSPNTSESDMYRS